MTACCDSDELAQITDLTTLIADLTAWVAGRASLSAYITQIYATKAAMDADLAHPSGTRGYVTADGANNGVYVKSGASGTGSWLLVSSQFDDLASIETAIGLLEQGPVYTLQAASPSGANVPPNSKSVIAYAAGEATLWLTRAAPGSGLEDADTKLDLNGNWWARQGIDTSALDAAVAVLQTDVATLQDDVTAAQGLISTLQGDVTAAEGDISTLQGNVGAVQGLLGTDDAGGDVVSRTRALEALRALLYASGVLGEGVSDYPWAIIDAAGRAALAVDGTGQIRSGNAELFPVPENQRLADGRIVRWALTDAAGRIALGVTDTGQLLFRSAEEAIDPEALAEEFIAGWADEAGRLAIGIARDGSVGMRIHDDTLDDILAKTTLSPDDVTGPGNTYNAVVLTADGLRRFLADGEGAVRAYLQREGSTTAMFEARGPIEFLVSNGQSRTMGGGADSNAPGEEIFTAEPVYPHHNLMLDDGTRGEGAQVFNPTTVQDFVPAFEVLEGTQGETQGSGWMRALHAAHVAASEPFRTYLYRSHGIGGTEIQYLVKGGALPAYANGLAELQKAIDIAALYGREVHVRAIHWSQGHADEGAGTPRATYSATLQQLLADYQTDYAALLPAGHPTIKMIIDQLDSSVAGVGRVISLAQYDAFKANPDITISTPVYHLPLVDFAHFEAKAYSILGEYQARAWRSGVVDGVPWLPLYPTAVSRSGADIDLTFNVPNGALVMDTVTLPDPGSNGFEFLDDSGATPAISSVTVTGADTVRVTLASIPAGPNMLIRYAFNGPGAVGRSGAWGNLRDSETEPSQSDPAFPLHNWCITFEEPVT